MASELKPCPFCAKPLTVRNGVNPYGRCDTEGCWMAEAKIGISCDDPKQVERWNTRPAPAATDTGLVTYRVEAQENTYYENGHNHSEGWDVAVIEDPEGDYVTRSQAEELLAAERAETERWQSIAKTRWQKLGKALADNAALTARIDVLESLRPHWAKGYSSDSIAAQAATTALTELWKILGASNQTEAVSKVVALEAKLAAAEKDVATWKANFWDLSDKTARAAMGGKPS
ncbi:MAG: hypothetical protein ACREQ3_25430 [Candidatus Binatia bacterium]